MKISKTILVAIFLSVKLGSISGLAGADDPLSKIALVEAAYCLEPLPTVVEAAEY